MSVASMLNRVVRSRAHVGRERSLSMTPKQQWRVMNLYPPFLGIGLRIYGWTDDWTEVRVKLLLTPFNRNNHGTAFGGSIGAMSDAFNALLLIGQLGPTTSCGTPRRRSATSAPGRAPSTPRSGSRPRRPRT